MNPPPVETVIFAHFDVQFTVVRSTFHKRLNCENG